MKKLCLLLLCLLPLLCGCDYIRSVLKRINMPETVTIDGTTYRTGFYGDLYPVFGQVGDIGSETRQDEVVFSDGQYEYKRINFEGHDWVHNDVGLSIGGTVYCAESEFEETRDYYSNQENFDYYYMNNMYEPEIKLLISEIDFKKFDDLMLFSEENGYKPFDINRRSNEQRESKTRRIPHDEIKGYAVFYRDSNDGYFTDSKHKYTIHNNKLLLIYYYTGKTDETLVVDVPDELGNYFIDLAIKYDPETFGS